MGESQFIISMRLISALIALGFITQLVSAAPRVVKTLDGESFEGEVQFTNNLVIVNATNRVALERLSELSAPVAPTNVFPAGKGTGLLGYYFGRTNFEGTVTVRLDEVIDFDWGASGPAQGVPPDRFSVVWTGEVEPPVDGDYQFALLVDDTARLTLSNQVVVTTGPRERGKEVSSSPVPMRAGVRYPVELALVNASGQAAAKLFWMGPEFARTIVPRERLHPRSSLSRHAAGQLSAEGLLATYYQNPDFSGETFTRVDPRIDFNWADRDPSPGFSRNRHGVRWHGQIRADHSEIYTFHVMADEPIRLWVDGRPLILPGGQYYMAEVKESLPLLAGERYDIRLDAQSTGNGATTKLMWSSASTPKAVIPSTNLFPSIRAVPAGVSLERSGRYPRGVMLRGGSYIALPVERATESSIRCDRWLKSNPISTLNAARIFCQPVSRAMADRIPSGRTGLLLANGDFVDGEFKSLENNQVKIGSVLFGARSYSAGREVLVVVLSDVQPRDGPFEIRLQDQSVLNMEIAAIDAKGLSVRDQALGRFRIDWGEVAALRRVTIRSPSR